MRALSFTLGLAAGFCWASVLPLEAQSYVVSTPLGYSPGGSAKDGTNRNVEFINPVAITLSPTGDFFMTDASLIRQIKILGTNWVVTTIAGQPNTSGTNDGVNTSALFRLPYGIAADAAGNLYIADTANNSIRRLAPAGTNWVSTTIAGLGGTTSANSGSADGTNSGARFRHPNGVAVDSATNVYVADTDNNIIRRVKPAGTDWVVTTIAGTGGPGGTAGPAGSADGTNGLAQFRSPAGIAVDSATNLYVVDSGNSTIRRISPMGTNWVVTTLAGLAGFTGPNDGTNSTARFTAPLGLAVDAATNLFVTDGNNTLRQVAPSGTNWVVTTLAGANGLSGTSDGVGTNAFFNGPWGIAVDSGDAVDVVDNGNYEVRFGHLAVALHISLAGNQVILSWPTNALGYVPEACGYLPPAGWTALSNTIGTVGGNFSVTNAATSPAGYYRLHKP